MKKLHFLCVALSIILLGCGGRYKIGGETFSSGSEALQKQTEILAHALAGITTTDNPVHGTVLFIFPSDVEIQKNYIRFVNPSRTQQEPIDFLITSSKTNFQFMADAIRKRGIFDSVSVERHNGNPASFPIGDYDYMVFIDVDGWFIRGKNNPRGLPITLDTSKPFGAPRTLSFLDSLSQQAKAIHSR